MDLSFLAPLNAAINALAAVFLVLGRRRISQGRMDAHRSAMLTAFSLSVLFLALYVARKASAGFESLHFHAGGAARIAYLALLGAHLILAPVVPVMAILLIVWAVRGRLDLHRRLARIAWPIWMFVSVSGIVIYLLVYPLNPVPGPPPIPE